MTIKQRIARLKQAFTPPPAVPVIPPMDVVELWHEATGSAPDPWQHKVLQSAERRICINGCRQSGKSTVVAVKELHLALYQPKSLILLLSRSLRQSGELARKVFDSYSVVGRQKVPPEAETKLALELEKTRTSMSPHFRRVRPMGTAITVKDLRDLVARRLGAETAADDVRTVCERLYTLALTPRGQELTTALPPSWWADVAELEPLLNEFLDMVEIIRVFRQLRPHVDLAGEFVYGG
jgi:hypothetical protein